jgi:multiple antibiotic resistance protein
MTTEILSYASGSFLVALSALISIVNPLGGALIYHHVTANRPRSERVSLAWRVAFYSAIVMVSALWIGASLMNFFGVSIEALRIAGGMVVAASAWEMLSHSQQTEDRKQEQAASAAGTVRESAFFPLTMPFTTGPGTIAVAIALSASRPSKALDLVPFYAGLTGAALTVAAIVGVCYASADRVVSLLGPARTRVLSRLSAFLLLCIGVQIFLTGLQGVISDAIMSAQSARR